MSPRRRCRAGARPLLFALLLCLAARPGAAVPVTAEARVRAAAGDVHGAARAGAQNALVEAVRTVVRRHVTSADLSDQRAAVQRAVLDHAPRYVARYSTSDERWDDLTVTVQVAAEVDRERVLARLVDAGIPVAELPVKPRLLLVALGPSAEGALGSLAGALEDAGYQSRIGARPDMAGAQGTGKDQAVAPVGEDQAGEWARAAGCHLTLVVEPVTSEGEGGPELPSPPLDGWATGLWFDPGGEPARESLPLVAWLVDPSGRLPLGRLEASGEGRGADRPEAEQAAARNAGRRLGYAALERLEQSGWVPEGVAAVLEVGVSGLTDPRLVEEIGAALSAVPEVRQVRLTEISRRRAAWHLEVVDAGLDWAAVLSTARLPRGLLEWNPPAPAGSPGPALPAAAGIPALTARWLGP